MVSLDLESKGLCLTEVGSEMVVFPEALGSGEGLDGEGLING